MPTPTELQFDGRLTNVSQKYRNEQMIAELAVPDTPVDKKEGTFKTYTQEDSFTVPPAYVGPKSIPNEVEWSTGSDTYACADFGFEEFLSQEEVDNADAPITPQSDTTEFVTDLVMLDQEIRTMQSIFSTSSYASGNQLDVAGAWSATTFDIIAQLEAGIDACFMPPTHMVVGKNTWRKMARNDSLLEVVKGTMAPQSLAPQGTLVSAHAARPQVMPDELAAFLGLEKILIGGAKYNTAVKGQTASYADVWRRTNEATSATMGACALIRQVPWTTRSVVSFARAKWKKRQVFTYPSVRGAFGGNVHRVVHSEQIKSIAENVGYLFKDTLVT